MLFEFWPKVKSNKSWQVQHLSKTWLPWVFLMCDIFNNTESKCCSRREADSVYSAVCIQKEGLHISTIHGAECLFTPMFPSLLMLCSRSWSQKVKEICCYKITSAQLNPNRLHDENLTCDVLYRNVLASKMFVLFITHIFFAYITSFICAWFII